MPNGPKSYSTPHLICIKDIGRRIEAPSQASVAISSCSFILSQRDSRFFYRDTINKYPSALAQLLIKRYFRETVKIRKPDDRNLGVGCIYQCIPTSNKNNNYKATTILTYFHFHYYTKTDFPRRKKGTEKSMNAILAQKVSPFGAHRTDIPPFWISTRASCLNFYSSYVT